MAIPVAKIIAFATTPNEAHVHGIADQVRNRLEWTWGLGHGNLDEHLRGFSDPQNVLVDDTMLAIPSNGMIRDIWYRNSRTAMGVRRPHIQKVYQGKTSYEYLLVPADPSSPIPARMWVSNLPPHLVLCATSGKISRVWADLTGEQSELIQMSLLERSTTAIPPNSAFSLSVSDFGTMERIHWTWSWVDYVPPSFLSEDPGQTLVEV
ncbi:hypothetical protein C8R43DRAFT_1013703, partial [Mycena crocata]